MQLTRKVFLKLYFILSFYLICMNIFWLKKNKHILYLTTADSDTLTNKLQTWGRLKWLAVIVR